LVAAPTSKLLWGSPASYGFADGTGTSASFGSSVGAGGYLPNSLTSDGAGNYFLCDTNNAAVRKITAAGVVTTLSVGTTSRCSASSGLCWPMACAYNAGFVYVADLAQEAVYKVDAVSGATSVFAGTPGPAGYTDGAAASALFRFCWGGGAYGCNTANRMTSSGLAFAPNGDLYIADMGNCVIRKVSGSTVSTVAGAQNSCSYVDGNATATARFNFVGGVAFDSNATNTALYIIDGLNQAPQVRMLKNGNVTTDNCAQQRRQLCARPPVLYRPPDGDCSSERQHLLLILQ
jgi:hypothetical protein